ncbi:hypothetical protein Ahy_A08g038871 [Arachis hypogaea]|uniref:NADH:quinone oxidoreductase/Mrp antiporter transmembrane domain-containing protein n=1 Tax=Arachis hypogaea TaxID=3818 RepID=A0A445BUW6_ARAHY|nr:hypothetical protein Ahy_A08g038871 [Arachis hypogaea]
MILGNLIAITQTSMKRMLAYSSIGQIGYVIIGIIVGDSNGGYASMINYMLFYISMNLGTFACIVLFGLRTGTDNIRDYAGLYTKDPFLALSLALCLLSLGGLPPLAVQDPTPLILLTGIKELVDLFRPKWEWARNLESDDRVDSMILSSFHTGPDRNRVIYILIMRKGSFEHPCVVPFHLGLGIGVIGPAFYISIIILDPIHLFGLLLNREIVSIAGNSNLIAFHTSQAAANSGLHLLASRMISLPSRARSRPSFRACTHASRATRLATAPSAFPQGCPKVPPPNWSTESSPKISVRAGICQT